MEWRRSRLLIELADFGERGEAGLDVGEHGVAAGTGESYDGRVHHVHMPLYDFNDEIILLGPKS